MYRILHPLAYKCYWLIANPHLKLLTDIITNGKRRTNIHFLKLLTDIITNGKRRTNIHLEKEILADDIKKSNNARINLGGRPNNEFVWEEVNLLVMESRQKRIKQIGGIFVVVVNLPKWMWLNASAGFRFPL